MRKHLFNLFFIYSFVFLGCEDPLDSVVTKKDSNELFELTLQASNKIVNSENSIDVMARIKRLKDGNSDVSNKVLGVWDLIYDYPDTLDNKILEIISNHSENILSNKKTLEKNALELFS